MKLGRLLLIVASVTAMACGLTEPSGPHAEEQRQLNRARSLWRAQNLSDYSYVVSRSCFCASEFREPAVVAVRGGRIVSVVSVASGAVRDSGTYQTIEGLFDLVEEAIDEEAATIRAEYDPVLGYLTSLFIDRDERMADEEIWIEATSLSRAP